MRLTPTPKELKQWRLEAGLTQHKLAEHLKITASHIAFLENGKRSPGAYLINRYWQFIPSERKERASARQHASPPRGFAGQLAFFGHTLSLYRSWNIPPFGER